MRLLHCADLHLGRRRLDGRLPDSDFSAAFARIVARAIEWPADALLIAGDLFETAQVPPSALRQAAQALVPLAKARIPVLAIEGNRDRPASDGVSWLRYLAEEGLLTFLHTDFDAEIPSPQPCDSKRNAGGFIDLGGVRFVGAGYPGAGAVRKLAALNAALPASRLPAVLLVHTPAEGLAPGAADAESLARLRNAFAYVALGHGHHPFLVPDEAGRPWAVNPGSPENVRLAESAFPGPRGWAEVELEPEALPGLVLANCLVREASRRPVLNAEVDLSPFGNKYKGGAEAIAAAGLKAIKALKAAPESIVRLALRGDLNVSRVVIETATLQTRLAGEAQVAGVDLDVSGLRLFIGRSGAPKPIEVLPPEEVERAVLAELLAADAPPGLEARADETSALYRNLRERVAAGASMDALCEALDASPLTERVRDARTHELG